MSRGLSKQQRRILAMLKTKSLVNDNRGCFTTQEVVIELNLNYAWWLMEVEKNPWTSNRKHHIDYKKFDKIRMSIYRALRSLERRKLIVSFTHRNDRVWGIPKRLREYEINWVKQEKEYRQADSECWKWGAFIRTLPEDLHLKYKLRIPTKEDIESIKKLWKKYRASSVSRV